MSRYILLPTEQKGETKSTYILVPIEGLDEGQEKRIQIPNNLNTFDAVYQDIKNKNTFKSFMLKLSKTDIYVNKDGFPADRETVLDGVSMQFAILDYCNELYAHVYEKFYSLLGKHGIL